MPDVSDRKNSAENFSEDLIFPHTNYFKNSFNYSGAVLWNSLFKILGKWNLWRVSVFDILRHFFKIPLFSKALHSSGNQVLLFI